MTDEDLDLIETDRLVDALGRRCKHVLVVECLNRNGEDVLRACHRGGWTGAVGLAAYASSYLLSPSVLDDRPTTDEREEK